MTASDLLHLRLSTQGVSRRAFQTAEDVVRWLGAAQSQDYPAAAWAVGQRARNATHAMLDRAFDEGRILRTHVMRPTWHFVMPADIRWMLQLTGPRVNAMSAPYYRKMELDERVFSRTRSTIARALRGGRQLTRADLAAELQKAGITKPNTPLRVSFIMLRAELDGLVCSGARIGRHFTYALLDERVPEAPTLDRDAALAELTRRYFTSHGPATVHDYSWWSGQTMGDARAGLEMVKSELVETAIDEAEGRLAVDLYAGVGLFALQLARRFAEVYAVEGNRIAASHGVDNVRANDATNVHYEAISVEAWLKYKGPPLGRPDFLLLDPPRSGAGEQVVQRITQLAPRVVSYVSCDPATLARDLRFFIDRGYQLRSIVALDMFPQTFHVETVARLEK